MQGVKPWTPLPLLPPAAGTGWRYTTVFGWSVQRDEPRGRYVVRDPQGRVVWMEAHGYAALLWALAQRP